MKQKLLALASALALCLSLAGCHISTPATVGAIGGGGSRPGPDPPGQRRPPPPAPPPARAPAPRAYRAS